VNKKGKSSCGGRSLIPSIAIASHTTLAPSIVISPQHKGGRIHFPPILGHLSVASR
jgi:hypothetical protein